MFGKHIINLFYILLSSLSHLKFAWQMPVLAINYNNNSLWLRREQSHENALIHGYFFFQIFQDEYNITY